MGQRKAFERDELLVAQPEMLETTLLVAQPEMLDEVDQIVWGSPWPIRKERTHAASNGPRSAGS